MHSSTVSNALLLCSLLCCFQAMKGEKGIPGVTVGEGLGEELTDESFCKYKCLHFVVNTLKTVLPLVLLNDTFFFFCFKFQSFKAVGIH